MQAAWKPGVDADFQYLLYRDGQERQKVRTAVRLRWHAHYAAQDQANAADIGKAPCQANRAIRMPAKGWHCEGSAPRLAALHSSMPGGEWRKNSAGRAAAGRAAV